MFHNNSVTPTNESDTLDESQVTPINCKATPTPQINPLSISCKPSANNVSMARLHIDELQDIVDQTNMQSIKESPNTKEFNG